MKNNFNHQTITSMEHTEKAEEKKMANILRIINTIVQQLVLAGIIGTIAMAFQMKGDLIYLRTRAEINNADIEKLKSNMDKMIQLEENMIRIQMQLQSLQEEVKTLKNNNHE